MSSHGGGVLNFYCRQGYELNGPAIVFCDGLVWDNHMPSCIPTNTSPSLFCDFENPDICHWTQDLNHDMDWRRDSYKTPTGYSLPTGPSYDHTKGKGANGHYMYLESSSRRINDTARLISPIFGKTATNTCLEFWYHMYGKTTGTLRAYMKKVTDRWPLNPANAIFTKSGNQGDVWYRATFSLGVIDQDFQIIMEGLRGNGYVSDTAIDDIRIITNCVYEDLIQTTTEVPLPVSENLKTIESCENRCGHKAGGTEGSQIIACDCDEFCFEASRCCPDFLDFCFTSSSTTDFESTTKYQTIDVKSPIPVRSNSTIKSIVFGNRQTPQKNISAVTNRMILPTKKILTPKQEQVPTRRPLIFVKATTPLIYQKILPNISKSPENKNTVKPITFKKKLTTTDTYSNDIMELPTRPNPSDVELLITSSEPLQVNRNIPLQEKEDYVENNSNKESMETNDPEDLGESKIEFRQSQSELSDTKMIFVVIATVCGIATLAIILVLVVVKYRIVRCRNRRMTSGNGDSQSDVRFLTADEVLDFNLNEDDF